MKLRNRTRKRNESLAEPMEDIERLARLADPDAAHAMLELLAKDHFIDSLTDEDMKLRIRQNRPESLQQVLEAALELSRIGWQAGNVQYQSVRRNSTARMTVLSQDRRRNESGCAGGVAAVY